MLIKNSREVYLHEVVYSFITLYNIQKDIKTAYITTATPLNELNLAALKEITKLIKSDSVTIVEKIDESIKNVIGDEVDYSNKEIVSKTLMWGSIYIFLYSYINV